MPIYFLKKNYIKNILFSIIGFIIFLILSGETISAGSIIIVIICLLPAMWLSLKTRYLSIQIFCSVALVTQLLSVPSFYMASDRYYFNNHRTFNFEVLDVFPSMMMLGIFLFTTALFVKVSHQFAGNPTPWDVTEQFKISSKVPVRKFSLIPIILFLVIISLSVKLWMFDMKIGIVGVEPPLLPFRLSGILFYTFNYFVPLTIAYIYIKTQRKSLALALLIGVYATIMGLASSSKGVVLLCTSAVTAFAWLDRKYIIFMASALITGLGVSIAAASRVIVHISDGQTTGAMAELGVFGTLFETIWLMDWDQVISVFLEITNRVEGFQGLFLASQFNAEVVGGAWNLLIKSMNHKWIDLDHDIMHQEYLGYTIPLGFYNIAASVNAWMLMASNKNVFMILPFALYAGITLMLLEKLVRYVGRKYKVHYRLVQSLLFVSTILFYTGPGSSEFIFLLSSLSLLSFMTAIRFEFYRSAPLVRSD